MSPRHKHSYEQLHAPLTQPDQRLRLRFLLILKKPEQFHQAGHMLTAVLVIAAFSPLRPVVKGGGGEGVVCGWVKVKGSEVGARPLPNTASCIRCCYADVASKLCFFRHKLLHIHQKINDNNKYGRKFACHYFCLLKTRVILFYLFIEVDSIFFFRHKFLHKHKTSYRNNNKYGRKFA